MGMPRRVMVRFGEAFPFGLYAVGQVEPELDFEKSSKDRPVQARDKETEQLVWKVEVMDPDPDAKKADRTITIKLLGETQPVLPASLPGLPFTPIELENMTASPWVDTRQCTVRRTARLTGAVLVRAGRTGRRGVKAPKNMPGTQGGSAATDKAA